MSTTPIDHKIEFMVWLGDRGMYNISGFKKHVFGITIYPLDSIGNIMDDWYRMDTEVTELMQLTSLRSINDEPIYNHQIVKDSRHGEHEVVDMFDYALMFALSITKLEIVGNRFQHPHLLKLCE